MSKTYTLTFDDDMAATIDRVTAKICAGNWRIEDTEAALKCIRLCGILEYLRHQVADTNKAVNA